MRKRSRNLLLFSWFEKKKHVETEKEPPKVYSALEVARHIINYVNSNDQLLSNLKLQKLLYFVQAEFLISQERICFTDDIATRYGFPFPYKVIYSTTGGELQISLSKR